MTAGLSFSPSFSLGDTAPESGKPFKWFSRVGDNEDPKLKLGENEKGRLQPAREKTNGKGCHDNEQRERQPWEYRDRHAFNPVRVNVAQA